MTQYIVFTYYEGADTETFRQEGCSLSSLSSNVDHWQVMLVLRKLFQTTIICGHLYRPLLDAILFGQKLNLIKGILKIL